MSSRIGSDIVERRGAASSAAPVGGAAKRAFDIVAACLALIAFAPLMIVIMLLVWAQDGGSPIFRHRRIGFEGRFFGCLKFRSMSMDAKDRLEQLLSTSADARAEWEQTHKLRDDPRITRLGVFLRKSSLDELPQLINILRGEMSFVGPRPIVAEEISRYSDSFKFYTACRPGLTGLWQVSGRTDVTYENRVALDASYMRSWKFVTDLEIVVGTIPAVLLRRGSC